MASTPSSVDLLTALAADGNTASVAAPAMGAVEVDVFVQDAPTWGSGTLKLQMSPDRGTTWIDVASASWTSGGGRLTSSGSVSVYGATHFRLNLAGSTTPAITPQIVQRRLEGRFPVQTNFTANGTSSVISLGHLPDTVGVQIFGTFGSGTVKFQVSADGGTTWYTVHSKTANDNTKVANLREGLYRFVLSGATSPVLTCIVT